MRATSLGLLVSSCLALPPAGSSQELRTGMEAYESRCVGCHGSDGTGGGHGPNVVDIRRPRAQSRDALKDLIRKGLPDAGMPPFALPEAELEAIAGYFLTLRSPAMENPAAGDAAAGERFFSGKGKCAECHMVRGRGGILGPDLSNLGRERKLGPIERSLTDPHGAGRVLVRMQDGRILRGLIRYEDPFHLGLQGIENRFYSLPRDQVATLVREKPLIAKIEATKSEYRDLLAYLSRLSLDPSPGATMPGVPRDERGVPFDAIARPKPGEWPTYHGHLSGNRNSPLTEINRDNVSRLVPKWIFPLPGAQRPLQGTPVVAEGIMYVTAVNAVWALDAQTGRQIWHYSRPRTQGLVGDPAAGINRGVAILGDRVFLQTDHAHLIALHRLTGQLLWDAEMADYRQHYGATGAPLVVNDLVIAGVSGGDEGIRGFLDAYKASTGERVWRFWTIPARGEPGSETWIGKAIEHGCGATWLTGAYDPATRLLYWPTGNPCPDYNGDERKGDNLYTSSVLALDPATGRLKWHYQHIPHDLHDWDSNQTPMLVDAVFQGRSRKLLVQAHRNGFFYVLDRLTGELLMAEPFVKKLTWASGIGRDGRPVLIPGNEPTPQGTRTCPAVSGATNWPSTAFNPATGLFYFMASESCNIFTKSGEWWTQGESFYGGGTRRSPGDVPVKSLKALDLNTGKAAWEVPVEGGILQSGVMSTDGGLVFYGDGSGAFVAVDAQSGKFLWHFQTGQNWKAGPMTYAVEGRQRIGVAAGATIMTFGLP